MVNKWKHLCGNNGVSKTKWEIISVYSSYLYMPLQHMLAHLWIGAFCWSQTVLSHIWFFSCSFLFCVCLLHPYYWRLHSPHKRKTSNKGCWITFYDSSRLYMCLHLLDLFRLAIRVNRLTFEPFCELAWCSFCASGKALQPLAWYEYWKQEEALSKNINKNYGTMIFNIPDLLMQSCYHHAL